MTCDLWRDFLLAAKFHVLLKFVPDLLDLSHKLNPLITITNITCLWDHRFLRNSLIFKLNCINYNVIKHKLTSQDWCQIFHDSCHAKCENFSIMNKAKCWRVSKRTAEVQIRGPEVQFCYFRSNLLHTCSVWSIIRRHYWFRLEPSLSIGACISRAVFWSTRDRYAFLEYSWNTLYEVRKINIVNITSNSDE